MDDWVAEMKITKPTARIAIAIWRMVHKKLPDDGGWNGMECMEICGKSLRSSRCDDEDDNDGGREMALEEVGGFLWICLGLG